MRKIKLLVVIGQLELGGAEKHLSTILPCLDRNQFEVTIFTFKPGGSLVHQFVANELKIVAPKHKVRGVLGLFGTATCLIKTVNRKKPDLIHFFLPEAYLLGGLCTFLHGTTKIMSRRCLSDYQNRRWYALPIEKFLHRKLSLAMANATLIKDQLESEGIPANKIEVINNGIDITKYSYSDEERRFQRERFGIEPDTCCILVIANLIPYKGHADLIDAMEKVNKKGIRNWKLIVLGADSASIKSDLSSQACAALIDDRILWLGQQQSPQPFLAAADIGVSASHEEGFSNAILEYMASGLAIIATAVGGSPEMIRHEKTGLLIPPRDPEALADRLSDLISSSNRRQQLGLAAKILAADEFTLEKCVARYKTAYAKLVQHG